MEKNRVETFVVDGVNYDVLKSVDHESEGFWTIGLSKNFETGQSKFRCIYIETT